MPLSNDHDRPAVPTQPGIDLSEEPLGQRLDQCPDSSFGTDDAVDFHASHSSPSIPTGTEISEEGSRNPGGVRAARIFVDRLNSRPTLPGPIQDIQPGRGGSESDMTCLPPIEDEADSSMIAKPDTRGEPGSVAAEPRPDGSEPQGRSQQTDTDAKRSRTFAPTKCPRHRQGICCTAGAGTVARRRRSAGGVFRRRVAEPRRGRKAASGQLCHARATTSGRRCRQEERSRRRRRGRRDSQVANRRRD
jgi:hypothetical protein